MFPNIFFYRAIYLRSYDFPINLFTYVLYKNKSRFGNRKATKIIKNQKIMPMLSMRETN